MRSQVNLFTLLLLLLTASAHADNPFVFKVRIDDTISSINRPIVQTGFRLQGKHGIYTALHGVAVGTIYSASNREFSYKSRLKSVDIENDVALLTDAALEANSDGLPIGNSAQIKPEDRIKIIGYPEAINQNNRTGLAGDPFVDILSNKLPPVNSAKFARRKSPLISSSILYIEAHAVPGESGAPVLNRSGQVIGIVDGGIDAGKAGICWAMQIEPLLLRPRDDERETLLRLASPLTAVMFGVAIDPPPPFIDKEGLYRFITESKFPILTRYEVGVLLFRELGYLLKPDGKTAVGPFPDVPMDDPAYDAVMSLKITGVLRGAPNGYLMGQRIVRRDEMALLLERILNYQTKPPTGSLPNTFTEIPPDVDPNHWAYMPIVDLLQKGILKTEADNKFNQFEYASYDALMEAITNIKTAYPPK